MQKDFDPKVAKGWMGAGFRISFYSPHDLGVGGVGFKCLSRLTNLHDLDFSYCPIQTAA